MPYLTVDEIRGDQRLDALSELPDTQLVGYVAEFEQLAEAYLDVAYEPRDATWSTLIMRTTNTLRLPHAHVRSVDKVTVNGGELAAALHQVDPVSGVMRLLRGYRVAVGDEVTVEYSHGHDEPPPMLVAACRRWVLLEATADATGTSRNVIGQSVDGSYVRYSTPDWSAGRPTGWLNVDRDLNSMRGDRPVLIA